MKPLTQQQAATLRPWFTPEQPGPVIGMHVIQTGCGVCHVDRWPEPRAVLAQTGLNYLLAGDPQALTSRDLQPHSFGMFAAPPSFLPLLRTTFDEVHEWPRVIYRLDAPPPTLAPAGYVIRQLRAADAARIAALDRDLHWIYNPWESPHALVRSGCAWGALTGERLVSLACTFFLGAQYEEIGVVTAAGHRGRGLSTACAAGLCRDIFERGRTPSWSTSTDNIASIRVAEKLGFTQQRRDRLYVVGGKPPAP